MANEWGQTISIDNDLAKELIEQQCDLKIDTISLFATGWDNVVFLVNQKFIFRFPRRSISINCLENEISILPYIDQRVSFPVTVPVYIGIPSKKYPAPFAGYQMLSGLPLSEMPAQLITHISFAKQLAQWLQELHAVPIHSGQNFMIKGDQAWRYNIALRLEKVSRYLNEYCDCFIDSGFELQKLFSIVEYFKLYNSKNIIPSSYCHGDLYSRHIFVDNIMNLSGIIDWGDIHIGNPGIDLSVGIMIFSDEALDVFLASYGTIDKISQSVMLLRAFWHSIFLLPYCYDQKDENLKQWTVLALKRVLVTIEKLS